jgi:hypothetical protein
MAKGDTPADEATAKGGPRKDAPAARPSDRWWLPLAVIAVFFAVVMVAATSALLLSGSKEPARPAAPTPVLIYGSGAPEDAVMGWAKEMEVRDYQAADTYLTEELLASGGSSALIAGDGTLLDLSIQNVYSDGGEAKVDVLTMFDTGTGGPVHISNSTISVVVENGTWRLDTLPVIYPVP